MFECRIRARRWYNPCSFSISRFPGIVHVPPPSERMRESRFLKDVFEILGLDLSIMVDAVRVDDLDDRTFFVILDNVVEIDPSASAASAPDAARRWICQRP